MSLRGVSLSKGETVDRALKRMKTLLDNEGILEEMRRRRSFETPVERAKRKLRSASKRKKQRFKYTSPTQDATAAAKAADRASAPRTPEA
jgi:small subunit ribosomal protein S21